MTLAEDAAAANNPSPRPPEELLQVGLAGPRASLLADATSIAEDLAFAAECAARYATLADDSDADPTIVRALWTSAAVSYRRAFASGKAMLVKGKQRVRLDREQIAASEGFTTDQREAHTLTLHLADQHVAHRVADVEDVRVVALLAPPPARPEVAGLGLMHVRMLGPQPAVARSLAEIAARLAAAARQEVAALREQWLTELATTEDVSHLYIGAVRVARGAPNEGTPSP